MTNKIMLNATGQWTGCNYADTPKYNAGEKNEIMISIKDKDILRKLAERISKLASRDIEKEKQNLWYSHNSLKSVRPLIFCDPENGWNEIITEDQIECENSLARRWEVVLKKELFWTEKICDDKPISSYFDISHTYFENDWADEHELIHGGRDDGSYKWDGPIKSLEDLNRIRLPKIEIDYKTTNETLNLAKDVFNNLLEVRLKGIWWWSFGLTQELARLVGLNEMLMFFYDKPELVHKVMQKLKEGYEEKLDFLEKNNLLFLNNDGTYVGSGGLGYSKELPGRNFDGIHIKPIDIWGFGESQETSGVSPSMFEEFVFKYQLPFLERFGLNCYGCCEPLDKRWYIIKRIPNLRRVSVSHWADKEKMTELLENKYIYSLKPTPADLAVPVMDKEMIRKKIKNYLEITKGCVLEIIMKDNHTLGKNPENLINWVKIVREEINKVY